MSVNSATNELTSSYPVSAGHKYSPGLWETQLEWWNVWYFGWLSTAICQCLERLTWNIQKGLHINLSQGQCVFGQTKLTIEWRLGSGQSYSASHCESKVTISKLCSERQKLTISRCCAVKASKKNSALQCCISTYRWWACYYPNSRPTGKQRDGARWCYLVLPMHDGSPREQNSGVRRVGARQFYCASPCKPPLKNNLMSPFSSWHKEHFIWVALLSNPSIQK